MDDHRSADALTGADLDREIEATLAVDPSPEFMARVRTRVQTERDASWSPWQWGVGVAAGALVVVVGVVIGMSRPNRSQIAQDAGRAGAHHGRVGAQAGILIRSRGRKDGRLSPGRPTTAFRTSAGRRSDRAAAANRAAAIAADEARALRQLFSNVRHGLIDLSSLEEAARHRGPSTAQRHCVSADHVRAHRPEAAEEGERQ
jgi:hypothetical protein